MRTGVDELYIDKLKTVPDDLNNQDCKSNKIDIDKIKPFSVNLKNLSDFWLMVLLKKDVFDKLFTKTNAISTSMLDKKTDYNANVTWIDHKIPNHNKFITAPDFNKLTEEKNCSLYKNDKFSWKK